MNLFFLAQTTSDAAARAAGAGVAGLGIVFVIIAILTSLFWIWMLIDCATNKSLDGMQKIVWILVILFLHVIGAIIYFAVGRGGKISG